MTKAFMVYFKDKTTTSTIFGSYTATNSPSFGIQCTPYTPKDDRPILVIAKTIDEAASRFKNADTIQELDVKDVIIDEKVDVIFELKKR